MKNNEALNAYHADTRAVTLLVSKDGSENWLEYTEVTKALFVANALRDSLAKINTTGIQIFGPFELID